jgi:cytochrome P450
MVKLTHDWDPTSGEVLREQAAAYDELRRRCPVAHSEMLGWSIFRHADITKVLADPETFSNVVSTHRSVPNGLDPPEHGAYRAALEGHFSDERLQSFEVSCRRLAHDLLHVVPRGVEFDFIDTFAIPFAQKCQCAFLGWSEELALPVGQWTRRNREAVLAADRSALAHIAMEFESWMGRLLEERRCATVRPDDVTSALMNVRVNGQLLTDKELISVFRNWTVGEVGSMAAAAGILAAQVARLPALQRRLRESPSEIPAAIEEMLRVEGPLVSNRRRVTRDVTLGGQHLTAGERVSLMWMSANRDENVFEEPESVLIERDQRANLLWGAGIHVCPGAPLARLQLRIALEGLLASSSRITLGSAAPSRLVYPENGWALLPLRFN